MTRRTFHDLEMTMTGTDYILDAAWHAERDRLNSLTELYDPTTLRLCERLGLTAGWRCLEVGAGTGSVAAQLATRVGPSGSVLALDVDTRFLDPLATDILQVRRADIVAEPPPAGSSIWCTPGCCWSTCRSATRFSGR